MAEQTKVTAAEGGVLNQLFNLLFKGMDNLLDAASEYQNDMGKLKQITNLDVIGPDNKSYVVTVKLAPIKNRDGVFYVEVESTYPEFNGEGVDDKVFTLNKNNPEQFKQIIEQLLEVNKLRRTGRDGSAESEEAEEVIECYKEDDFIEWSEDGYKGQPPKIVEVTITESPSETKGKIRLSFDCKDVKLYFGDVLANESDVLSELDPSKKDRAIDKVLNDSHLIDVEEAEARKEGDTEPEEESAPGEDLEEIREPEAANYVDVSLSYVKSSDEVEMNSIYASCDIKAALDSIDQIVNDDDFVATLTEEPQAFRITDEGEDFNIVPIEIVDTTSVTSDIAGAMSNLATLLDAYYVDLSAQQQAAANAVLSVLEQNCAVFEDENIVNDL